MPALKKCLPPPRFHPPPPPPVSQKRLGLHPTPASGWGETKVAKRQSPRVPSYFCSKALEFWNFRISSRKSRSRFRSFVSAVAGHQRLEARDFPHFFALSQFPAMSRRCVSLVHRACLGVPCVSPCAEVLLLRAAGGLVPAPQFPRNSSGISPAIFPQFTPNFPPRPLLSGWLILYRGGGGGSEAKKTFVCLKSTSKFGPL